MNDREKIINYYTEKIKDRILIGRLGTSTIRQILLQFEKEIKALFPDIEELRKQLVELDEGFKQMHQEAIEQAKREERERIHIWGQEKCTEHNTAMNNIYRDGCEECWQALKEKT